MGRSTINLATFRWVLTKYTTHKIIRDSYFPGFCRASAKPSVSVVSHSVSGHHGRLPRQTHSSRNGFDDDRTHKYALPSVIPAMPTLTPAVNPFDVVKTRLQTQPKGPLLSRTASTRCCQPSNVPCVRNMSSLVHPFPAEEVVCVYHHGMLRKERVSGFLDAVRHVVKAEGIRGLWKGVGTTL